MRFSSKLSRREFLAWSAVIATGTAVFRELDAPSATSHTSVDELIELSAIDAVRAMREGDIKAEDYATAPLGVAEDTQGSIRVPAALCGICGFRPTTGRYPTAGVIPITPLFDQVGPHARTVADLTLFDTVFTSDETLLSTASLKGVRFGIDRAYDFATLNTEVERLTKEALRKLEDAGAVLVEAEVPKLAQLIGPLPAPEI